MPNPFASIEQAIKTDWDELTGEARRDALAALADVKADLAKVEPAAQALKAELEQAVQAALPSVTQAVGEALGRFLAAIVPQMTETGDGDGARM